MPVPGQEQRATRRFPLKLPVTVKSPIGGVEAAATTRDVSARGVCFFLETAIVERGSFIEFTLTLPPEITMTESIRVRCRGRVVRVESTAYEGRTAVAAQIEKYEFLSEHNA
ncbi:MAG: PilZ domain-containing protein [Acidobacteriaceae bacterium]